MNKTLIKISAIIIVGSLIYPSVSLAVWWNPFSWKIPFRTPQKIEQISTSTPTAEITDQERISPETPIPTLTSKKVSPKESPKSTSAPTSPSPTSSPVEAELRIELSANRYLAPADGSGVVLLTASVKNGRGEISNTFNETVQFISTISNLSQSSLAFKYGFASAELRSLSSPGIATIYAQSGRIRSNTVNIEFMKPAPESILDGSISAELVNGFMTKQTKEGLVKFCDDAESVQSLFFLASEGLSQDKSIIEKKINFLDLSEAISVCDPQFLSSSAYVFGSSQQAKQALLVPLSNSEPDYIRYEKLRYNKSLEDLIPSGSLIAYQLNTYTPDNYKTWCATPKDNPYKITDTSQYTDKFVCNKVVIVIPSLIMKDYLGNKKEREIKTVSLKINNLNMPTMTPPLDILCKTINRITFGTNFKQLRGKYGCAQ